MTELISLYIAALKQVDWQDVDKFESSRDISLHWLLEKGSLSRRLEENCDKLTVKLLTNTMRAAETISTAERGLLSDTACLLREVVLSGDGCEWVVGRTLIPDNSLLGQPYDLTQQGEIPLGLTVFSAESVHRDGLQLGWVTILGQTLIARRSRLWMNNKPLLVAELFLPGSPVYSKEGNQ